MAIELGTYCDVCDQDITSHGVKLCKACYDRELASAQDGSEFVFEIEAARRVIQELKAQLTQARVELLGEKMKGGH